MRDLNPAPRLIERFRAAVEYLKNGTDSQAGFYALIRNQESDLILLGARLADLVEENRKLYEALQLPLPNFRVRADVSYDPIYADTIVKIEYEFPQRYFKMAVSQQTAAAMRQRFDDRTRRQLRWRAYMGMCRSIRAMLDKALREANL